MWWCCGKSDKNAPGCKFSKHEIVIEDDNEKQFGLEAKDK
jgi:hypothetical protein